MTYLSSADTVEHTLTLAAGRERPKLTYHTDGDRLVVFAAVGGAPQHPSWFHEVLTHPEVTVELDGETFPAVAAVTTGRERYRIWSTAVRRTPALAEYQVRAGARTIPVITLRRREV
ncbi:MULTISPECIES: nitroreductase/quinone reductase family protein [unclassified Crossiella]|uniref:nitroreductase/quinone reductase family protein n=1 Tax=Crossiella sp. CA-258035 TaxID=2981138 RepID=UPI0024BD265E|nr:nitroreductase/quinone reductase family protein [Crossiella sp. CA-258035]WHT15773.1 nitroreductase/quinone reductase family protein [Crossiella sp. CA-258035]